VQAQLLKVGDQALRGQGVEGRARRVDERGTAAASALIQADDAPPGGASGEPHSSQ
jgi:hypothetical protein